MKVGILEPEEEAKLEKQMLRELRILQKCDSIRVVSFYGAFLHDGDINIMMEYMDLGTIDCLYKKAKVPEMVVAQITFCVLDALIYLYDHHKIVHRGIR